MKAIFCEKFGGPDDLVLREVASPTPKAGEVKVALRARGVSYVDVLVIAGQYQTKQEVPFIPGGEATGVVVEVGEGVETVHPGDRVLVSGGYAEEVVVPAHSATLLPDAVSFEAAAGFRSNYSTAYYGLQRGRLLAGEILLVHGAAGGVGLAAVDMGKLLGATVIATASTDEKLAVCKQIGADHVINYTDGFREQVKDLTGGRGADVIYDPVGGDVFDGYFEDQRQNVQAGDSVLIVRGIGADVRLRGGEVSLQNRNRRIGRGLVCLHRGDGGVRRSQVCLERGDTRQRSIYLCL